MQRVGLSLQPEQFEKLAQLINTSAIDITEISSQPDNLDDEQALMVLAELLRKTYHETQAILDQF